MASTISALTLLNTPAEVQATDLFEVVRASANYRAPASAIASYLTTLYQPVDADLTAIAALGTTAFGRGLLPLADAAAVRTYVGAADTADTLHLTGTEVATGAKTFRNVAGIRTEQVLLQDAMILKGSGAGTTGLGLTLTSATLGANRTQTFQDADGTIPLDALVVHIAGVETVTGAKTFSALLTATLGLAVSGGDISLVRTDAADSVVLSRGLTGQVQAFEASVSSTQRWSLYRETDNSLRISEDNTGVGGGLGVRFTMAPGGGAAFASTLSAVGISSTAGLGILGGAFGAGSISQDPNWGAYYRAAGTETTSSHAWANTTGTVKLRLLATGELLLDSAAGVVGGGRIQLATGTTDDEAILFGDITMYRSGAATMQTNAAMRFLPSAAVGAVDLNGGNIEIGYGRTSAGVAYIDLTTETGTPDYNLRLIRAAGTNADVNLNNTGTGVIYISPNELGAIAASYSVTAGDTRLMVYDVDNGVMERVTVGAADSGGAGFKVLRIPN